MGLARTATSFRVVLGVSFAVSFTLTPAPSTASLPIFGGPTYSPAGGGANSTSVGGPPGKSVGEGFAVGVGNVVDPAHPSWPDSKIGYRWDAFGGTPVNLGNHTANILFSPTIAVNGIARSGAAVGSSYAAAGPFPGSQSATAPLRWSANNVEEQLGLLDAQPSGSPPSSAAEALAINAGGTAVGDSALFFNLFTYTYLGPRAVRWNAGSTTPVNLGTPSTNSGGFGISKALAISDSGIITGVSELFGSGDADLGQRIVRWAPGSTTPIQLDTLGATTAGVTQCTLNAANGGGTVVGTAFRYTNTATGAHVVVPARWDGAGTGASPLGTLSGDHSTFVTGSANDVNDAGVAVGYSVKRLSTGAARGERAVRWNAASTGAVELPTINTSPTGVGTARAAAINNLNVSVGYSDVYFGEGALGRLAVLWRDDGSIVDLNSYLPGGTPWLLTAATDISEAGFISGTGNFTTIEGGSAFTYTRGFMMLVPEAGTYGLGDANFDAKVDFGDLVLLAQHYGESNPTQSVSVADFDLDGDIDFDDLVKLAQHYNYGTGAAATGGDNFAADWALAQSLVPEPCLMTVAIGLMARRRQRRIFG